MVKGPNERSDGRLGLAQTAWNEGDFDEAIRWLEQLETMAPPNIAAFLLLARLRVLKGDNQQALALVEQLNDQNLTESQIRAKARILEDCGHDTLAQTLLAGVGASGEYSAFRRFVEAELQPQRRLGNLRAMLQDWGNCIYSELLFNRILQQGSISQRIAAQWLQMSWGGALRLQPPGFMGRRGRNLPPGLGYDKDYGRGGTRIPANPELISLLCPIHRPSDVENLIHQVLRQDWPRIEVVVLINDPSVPEAKIRSGLEGKGLERVVIINDPESPNIGTILNRSIEASKGNLLARFDADDVYTEVYLKNSADFLDAKNADIIGKGEHFYFMEDRNVTLLQLYPRNLGVPTIRQGGGASLFFRRSVVSKLKFNESLRSGEDTEFCFKAPRMGFKFVSAPPFDHLAIRKRDVAEHTFRASELTIAIDDAFLVGIGFDEKYCQNPRRA